GGPPAGGRRPPRRCPRSTPRSGSNVCGAQAPRAAPARRRPLVVPPRLSCSIAARMTTIRTTLLQNDQLRQGAAELIDEWRRDSGDVLWVDIQHPTQATIEPLLEERFGFHELAAEDSLSDNTLPKYDSFAEYDFFIFRAVDVDLNEHASQTYKLAAFLGKNFLFTIHRDAMHPIDNVCNRLPADQRVLVNGPDFLLYQIVDQMVD